MSFSLEFRKADADDLPFLAALEQASFPRPWSEGHLRAEIERALETESR